jgi:hypothetical protein
MSSGAERSRDIWLMCENCCPFENDFLRFAYMRNVTLEMRFGKHS